MTKALSTLSQKSATVAENDETTSSRTFLRQSQIVASVDRFLNNRLTGNPVNGGPKFNYRV